MGNPTHEQSSIAPAVVKFDHPTCAELLAALKELLNQSRTNRAVHYERGGSRFSNERINMNSAAEVRASKAIAKAEGR